MDTLEQIKEQQRVVCRNEQSLALVKLKKRRADTRRKIELGGLIIKSKFDKFNKLVVLGALDYAVELIEMDERYNKLFAERGQKLFSPE